MERPRPRGRPAISILIRVGTNHAASGLSLPGNWLQFGSEKMGGIIYLVGLVVIILAVLSFFGLR